MEMKSILLVEDDFLNRRLTKKILLENRYHVLEAKNYIEAIQILKKEKILLAILDIHLGEGEQDGISLGQEIHAKYRTPFIYLTAYDNTEIINKAVMTAPYSYLTKPFKNIDLIASVEIAIQQSKNSEIKIPTILVKDIDYTVELPTNTINYIESDGNYLLFYTDKKIYKSRATIKQMMDLLPQDTFIQTHRAFIVNTQKIEKFNIKSIVIKNTIIPVSKKYIDNIDIVFK